MKNMNAFREEKLTVATVLGRLRGKRVHFDELHGNNGDRLISMGATQALNKAGAILSSVDDRPSAIVVTGGAGLSSVWGGAYEEVMQYCQGEFATIPLVILPSTMSFEANDFAKKLMERKAETTVFAREQYTFKRFAEAGLEQRVKIGIDHDMAFELQGSSFMRNLRQNVRQRHILIVERGDTESLSAQKDVALAMPSRLKRILPMSIKRLVKIRMHERQRKKSQMSEWALSEIRKQFGRQKVSQVRCVDVSLPSLVSFQGFCHLIKDSAVVATTRLHVAILAAMLGKPTLVIPGSAAYGKIQGIYDYSLSKLPHVRMVPNPFQ